MQNIFDLLEKAKEVGAPEGVVYRKIRSFLEQKARETGTPRHGHFELTPLCNFDCKMCYIHLTEAQMQGRRLLPAETWISIMQQAIDAGMASANLSGGECLTYPQFDEVYLFLKSKGIEIGVMTNGLLLNRERIDFFKQYRPSGIQITLYGNSEDAYERVTGKRVFSTVLENIKTSKEAGLPVFIMITPSRYMSDTVKDTIRLAKSIELPYYINYMLTTPRDDTGREKGKHDLEVDEYVDIYCFDYMLNNRKLNPCKTIPRISGREQDFSCDGLKCGAGRSSFSIRWNGSMLPCTELDGIVADPEGDGFSAAWEFINREVSRYPSFNKCGECTYSQVCTFCAAENEKRGSRYNLNNIWCERTWKIVEAGLAKLDTICE